MAQLKSRNPDDPQDIHERERIANLRPQAWVNPEPAGRYRLVVVGSGFAGLVAAQMAAARGVKVALIERDFIGGTCINTGCVPSKAIIRTSRLYAEMRDASRYGAQVPSTMNMNFAATMQRVRRIRTHLGQRNSVRRLTAAGIDVFFGDARFVGMDTLTVNATRLRFDKALIATGARPNAPTVPGLAQAGYLTNENMFDMTELPRRLLVIGGGPIGCEQAQAFGRLGAQTTIVQDKPLFLEREERDAAQILSTALAHDGVEVRLNTRVRRVRMQDGEKLVDLISDDYENTVAVDAILTGIGRTPNVESLGLETAGVEYDDCKGVYVDDFLRSSNARIFAAGDVCLEDQYGHTAIASAKIAVRNALFRGRQRWSTLIIPWCTFTDPEIAHVGLHVRDANKQGIPVKTFTILMHEVDRAITDSEDAGFVKIHVREGTDKILGATIVARHAGDMINEITLAMVESIGLRKLTRVMHAYDTLAEAIQRAANACERTLAGGRK